MDNQLDITSIVISVVFISSPEKNPSVPRIFYFQNALVRRMTIITQVSNFHNIILLIIIEIENTKPSKIAEPLNISTKCQATVHNAYFIFPMNRLHIFSFVYENFSMESIRIRQISSTSLK